MPASTPSPYSSSRAPAGRWALTWAVACVIAVAMLGTWEGFWRSRGFRPVVADSMHLWSLSRARVADGGPDTVVLMGSSIMQVAVDLDLLSRETRGLQAVQLAMTASSPLPTLEDLAQDSSFRGIAVCEHAGGVLDLATDAAERLPRTAIDFHRRASLSWAQAAERQLRLLAQDRAVSLSRGLAPDQLLQAFVTSRWPSPHRRIMGADRVITLVDDHGVPRVDPAAVINLRRQAAGKGPPQTAEALEVNLRRIEVAVETIRRRGGEVVFVLFACQGPLRDQIQPRSSRHWERIAARTDAVLLNLEEEPYATELHCPDGAHLDEASQKRFTRILARTLNQQVLPERRRPPR